MMLAAMQSLRGKSSRTTAAVVAELSRGFAAASKEEFTYSIATPFEGHRLESLPEQTVREFNVASGV